ncbi:PilZ domain protein [Geotalea daltonii FRC-32]|uniref:PilZ domain protein n=1 Tax=Geotalea daltonii (strain DSM 22248 / JCM 15807 / FRC-32) TaxID=316067 RepID=B9M1Z4_GEODF|nr:PilZ domain-containing protein [Geotalea daltonii]ACM19290.1 PilZ domain protein [Geotalea daltonii FRC-32]
MADKRRIKRLRKRLSVKFGLLQTDRIAFTEDISHHGLFIKTANVASPGSDVKVDLAIDETTLVRMEARVMWAKKVPANMLRLVKKSGMGVRIIRILDGEDAFNALCRELDRY